MLTFIDLVCLLFASGHGVRSWFHFLGSLDMFEKEWIRTVVFVLCFFLSSFLFFILFPDYQVSYLTSNERVQWNDSDCGKTVIVIMTGKL